MAYALYSINFSYHHKYGRAVFSNEYIANYIKRHGTLQERLAALKAKYKQNKLD
jgi:hypothetical protein